MNITTESYGHAMIFNLKGELTEDSLSAFQKAVEHQLEGKEVVDVVLNMEQVPFIDSLSLEYLLDLQDRLVEHLGQVKLVKCDENIQKILTITRLDTTLEVFAGVAEAVEVIRA
ncbi:MAG: STAS domain-containing protein [Planctomycetota bacterium]|nr:STAS domain-containing protein [Planctomycetota bacterium]